MTDCLTTTQLTATTIQKRKKCIKQIKGARVFLYPSYKWEYNFVYRTHPVWVKLPLWSSNIVLVGTVANCRCISHWSALCSWHTNRGFNKLQINQYYIFKAEDLFVSCQHSAVWITVLLQRASRTYSFRSSFQPKM